MPALDLKGLEKQIQSGRLPPLYVFAGEDVRQIDAAVDAVEGLIDPADRPFAVERVYAGDNGGAPIDIAAAARVYPMLGNRRLVIVLRAEKLLKPKRATKAADGDEGAAEDEEDSAANVGPLEDYVANPVDSTTLIFVAADIDRSRRFTKRLLEKAHLVLFQGLGQDGPGGRGDAIYQAVKHVQEGLALVGRTIDPKGARLLAERSGGEISRLRGDIERLVLYAGDRKAIGLDDVQEIVSLEVGVEDEWAVVNALGDGDAGRALREVGRRMERGDSPHALVGQLRWWVSTKLAEREPGRVPAALDALLRTDLALKSSGGDERVLVERLVVDLTGKPQAQRRW